MLARNPSRRPGRYCIRFSRVLTRAVSSVRLRLANDTNQVLLTKSCSTDRPGEGR
jgi:hypothetical protein